MSSVDSTHQFGETNDILKVPYKVPWIWRTKANRTKQNIICNILPKVISLILSQ